MTDTAILLWRHYGWSKELFFKELKGTLGFHHYRFVQFTKVAGWAQACLAAFGYLEWYRARQLARRDLGAEAQRWWSWQRTHGLRLAVVPEAEEQDLAQLYRLSGTPSGRKKLRRGLREALPLASISTVLNSPTIFAGVGPAGQANRRHRSLLPNQGIGVG